MADDTLEIRQRIVPALQYEDVGAAVDFLTRAFGFVEKPEERMAAVDGRVWHASLDLLGTSIMLGTVPGYRRRPKGEGVHQSLCVYVDDVDAHCAHAEASGAAIVTPLKDQFWGDRNYSAEDPEGHQWHFAQRVHHVAPEAYAPSEADLKRHLD